MNEQLLHLEALDRIGLCFGGDREQSVRGWTGGNHPLGWTRVKVVLK